MLYSTDIINLVIERLKAVLFNTIIYEYVGIFPFPIAILWYDLICWSCKYRMSRFVNISQYRTIHAIVSEKYNDF